MRTWTAEVTAIATDPKNDQIKAVTFVFTPDDATSPVTVTDRFTVPSRARLVEYARNWIAARVERDAVEETPPLGPLSLTSAPPPVDPATEKALAVQQALDLLQRMKQLQATGAIAADDARVGALAAAVAGMDIVTSVAPTIGEVTAAVVAAKP